MASQHLIVEATSPLVPELCRFVSGQHCTVFGSAPGRKLPAGYEDSVIVCANGAGYGLARSADLTVLGAGVSRAGDKTSRHTLRNMNGRFSERVLFVNPGKWTDYAERFRDFGFAWRSQEVMTAEARAQFVLALTGYSSGGLVGPDAHSNGVLALLLAAAAGATRIDATGFSLSPGHFYIEDADTPRNHAGHDLVAMRWLATNAPVRFMDDELRNHLGNPAATAGPLSA
ncbi:hypothetical protein [Luteimonas kalidii]|uniref:Uncharacterized protein n=1 Tax=Luteimonas kalidii TaxID=3042025 RepID=A0ABT6JRZ3_9GAMM|nr:hypothetical protein [Luteimonas kalidii]MDH5833463.1 hypothetical protein [Luteimonas kalidii]